MSEGETTYYRYMSRAEAEAVEKTGFLRGGIPGEVFFTEDLYERADEAKSRLALKVRPEVRLRFKIVSEIDFIRVGSEVGAGVRGAGRRRRVFDARQGRGEKR